VAFVEKFPKRKLSEATTPKLASVTEILDDPFKKTSNLFTEVEVIVYAIENLYQTPAESVAPSLPIWAVLLHSCKTPAEVSRKRTTFPLPVPSRAPIDAVALGSTFM
jgi:hypothetical protein